jgi:hypothetical protein
VAVAWAAAAIASGVRGAVGLVRARDPALIGALAWWDSTSACCGPAFTPSVTGRRRGVAMAYFTGMVGNLLPLPGGIGGVEASMIGALIAFDVAGSLAVVAC